MTANQFLKHVSIAGLCKVLQPTVRWRYLPVWACIPASVYTLYQKTQARSLGG